MKKLAIPSILLLAALGLSGCDTQTPGKPEGPKAGSAISKTPERAAPLFDNIGTHHHPITTQSAPAQRYFDQGLIFAFGFNHAEAERSFREAVRNDPDCAICYWGAALVLGPNINAAMDEEAVPKAYEMIQGALAVSNHASEQEQAYIQALAKRYDPKPLTDRTPLDEAYAEAMRKVVERFPEDLDAATLLAEALMDLHPWKYWKRDGTAEPWTPEILSVLESVLERASDHPGANHLYVHAVEASPLPERAEASADRLRTMVPGIDHLVHMPAHIYIRVGRYHDAVLANERAIEADQAYVAQTEAQGLYPIAYMPHNHHFLWASVTMEGQSERAVKVARHMAADVDPTLMRKPGYGTLQHFWVTPLYALVRFGGWEAILAEPAPPEDLLYPTGVWHYARGMALLRTGRLEEASGELEKLDTITADPALASVTIWETNKTSALLRIASEVLSGELVAKRGSYKDAVTHLERAVHLEDDLVYDEPPPWHQPVRQMLGAVLLEAGLPKEAERVYQEDLRRFRENGWSLFGLGQSLRAQGKTEEAREVEKRFAAAWARADVTLQSSRF